MRLIFSRNSITIARCAIGLERVNHPFFFSFPISIPLPVPPHCSIFSHFPLSFLPRALDLPLSASSSIPVLGRLPWSARFPGFPREETSNLRSDRRVPFRAQRSPYSREIHAPNTRYYLDRRILRTSLARFSFPTTSPLCPATRLGRGKSAPRRRPLDLPRSSSFPRRSGTAAPNKVCPLHSRDCAAATDS